MAKKKSKKKLPAQQIKAAIQKRGTEGTFREWCKRHGFSGGNAACANYALRQYKKGKVSKDIMEKARTAKAFASMRKKKK
ncbi:hypothetical protein DRP04_00950 [Archaeoglobales archaeon]|nr:MAG: hypothetical protein DRP04_00950 [Archaeoglobales archaeon]